MTVSPPRALSLLRTLFLGAFWRSKLARWHARRFDRRHGTDTIERLPVEQMNDIAPELARHAVHYEASAIPKFRTSIKAALRAFAGAVEGVTFIDVGSGKGLVIMLASEHRFRRIVGIEMSPELHRIAMENLRRFARTEQNPTPIELICADALAYELPPGPLLVYLYNPFDAVLMERFAQRLALAAASRRVIVIYVNPQHSETLTGARFRLLHEGGTFNLYGAGEGG